MTQQHRCLSTWLHQQFSTFTRSLRLSNKNRLGHRNSRRFRNLTGSFDLATHIERLEDRVLLSQDDLITPVLTAPSVGTNAQILAFDGSQRIPVAGTITEILPYNSLFAGGVNVASGDVNGDGIADIITGAGAGGGPHVKVFGGEDGTELFNFFAYSPLFAGGVSVASGDVNGDGFSDIITGAGAGGGPHVKVFSGADGTELSSFFAYDPSFAGGVNVASGDVNWDGFADIITGAGPGGGPHVKVFSGKDGELLQGFFAYDRLFSGGVNVASGDVNLDGFADIVIGAGTGGGPHVKVFSGKDGELLQGFFAFDPLFSGGVNVASGDVDGDGFADIITGAGSGGGPHVRGFSGATGEELFSYFADDPNVLNGVNVAVPYRDPLANQELHDAVILVPGESGEIVSATLTVSGSTAYQNELGIYPVDDAQGRIGTLLPEDDGYAQAAVEAAVFHRQMPNGDSIAPEFVVELDGSQHYGLFLIQNSTSEEFLANNPLNDRHGSPFAFFSFNAASLDGFDHLQYDEQTLVARWEDLMTGGDRDFNDVVVEITFERNNKPPVLDPISDQEIQELSELSFTVTASDPDTPADNLRFSLGADAPAGATIDPDTGEFTWTPDSSFVGQSIPLTIIVTDDGNPNLSDLQTIMVSVSTCHFHDDLAGWIVTESGGSLDGQGSVTAVDCVATLTEGDSFVVTLSTSFIVPENATEVRFTYADLNFDTSDPNFVNDAFEAALVDQAGNSLVNTFTSNRDAFFNITEGMNTAVGNGVTIDGETVRVNVSNILAGETATLVFRLLNNDFDETTTVSITSVDGLGQLLNASASSSERFSNQSLQSAIPTAVTTLGFNREAFTVQNQVPDGSDPTTGDIPLLSITAPGRAFSAGTKIVFGGLTQTRGILSNGQPNTIEFITINGRPVEVLDAAGAFFTSEELLPGANEYTFIATDSIGQISEAKMTLFGTQPSLAIDLNQFSDVTGSLSGVYGRTSFQEETRLLHVDLATRNDGRFESDVPLLVGVKNISESTVSVVNFDGFLEDGTPYFDFSMFVAEGRLNPGEITGSPTISFFNPNRQQFDYELVFLGKLNEAPIITTVPRIEAFFDRDYRYDVDATDADGDTLTYSLLSSPAGMQIHSETGEISWQPTIEDSGFHGLEILVDDGRGGTARQRYTITVNEASPNRPPIIISTPVTFAYLRSHFPGDLFGYKYLVLANDPDNDDLHFSLSTFPTGMQIDSASGWISWIPEAHQIGNHNVVVKVTDGNGGMATQEFIVCVHPDPANHDPAIISEPNPNLNVSRPVQFDDFSDTTSLSLNGRTTVVDNKLRLVRGEFGTEGSAFVSEKLPIRDGFVTEFEYRIAPGADGLAFVIQNDSADSLGGTGAYLGYGTIPYSLAIELDTFNNGAAFGIFDPSNNHIAVISAGAGPNNSSHSFALASATPPFNIDDGQVHRIRIEYVPGQLKVYVDDSLSPLINVPVDLENIANASILDGSGNAFVGFTAGNGSQFSVHEIVSWQLQTPRDEYTYDVIAIDPDNDALTYSLIDGPEGMTINAATGLVEWIPLSIAAGVNSIPVTIGVNDGRGGYDEQSFMIDLQTTGSGEIRGAKRYDNIAQYLVAESTFDEGFNGWTVPNNTTDVRHQSTGGNPGGYLQSRDLANPSPRLEAPAEFLGDWTSYDNTGVLLVDHKVFHPGGSITEAGPVRVILSGPGGIAQWNDTFIPNGTTDWLTREVLIVESEWTIQEGNWAAILANVTSLSPSLEINSNDTLVETNGLDNIRLFNLPSLAGWTIYLDQNQNGLRDIGEQFTLTDQNGDYAFTSLPEEVYYVREELKPGWVQTVPANGVAAQLLAISEVTNDAFAVDSTSGAAVRITGLDTTQIDSFEILNSQFAVFGHNRNRLSQLNLLTGEVSVLGSISGIQNIEGLAFDGATLYGTVSTDLDGAAERIATFDITETGILLTDLGVLGSDFTDVDSLAVLPDGRLLFTDLNSQRIGTYAPATGDVQTLGTLDYSIIGLDVDRNGTIFATTYDLRTEGNKTLLLEIDLSTLTSTVIGEMEVATASGLAVRPDFSSGDGYRVDLRTNEIITDINFANAQVGDISNQNPEFTSIAIEQAEIGNLYRYDVTASDPENDVLTYLLSIRPEGMTVHPTLGTIVWTPGEDQLGEHDVLLRVQDGNGRAEMQLFRIDVTTPNVAPVITSSPIETAVAGQSYRYRLRAQDANGDPINYRLDTFPAEMTIEQTPLTNSAGQFVETFFTVAWDVPASGSGTSETITVIADDGRGGEVSQTWTLNILDPATASANPTITSTPNTTARFGLEWTYLVEAMDADDGDTLQYTLLEKPLGMQITSEGFLTWVVPTDAPAMVPVEILVSDGRGGETRQAFDLSISAVTQNQRPTITSVPTTRAVVDTLYNYDVVASDPDADSLLWSLSTSPRGMSIDTRTGKIRWMPDDQQLGTHIVAVTVIDPFLQSFTQRYEIHVGCNNLAPAIVSVPPTVALTDRTYIYAVRADDFENDPLTWQLLEAPDGMSFDPGTSVIRWTPTTSQFTSHDVVIEVSDGINTSTQTYTIVVNSADDPVDPNDPTKGTKGNRAPLITSVPIFNGEADALYQYQVTAIDLEGDTFSFALAGTPPTGMEIDANGLITWSPLLNDVGAYPITVQVMDEQGATSTQGYLLNIAENLPPVINSNPVLEATSGSLYRYTVNASDPEGGPLRYTLDEAPVGMTIDRFGRITWQTRVTDVDPQAATVTVTDNRGQSISQSWQIAMVADTQAPNVSIIISAEGISTSGDAQLDVLTNYTLRVNATDNVSVSQITLLVDGSPVTLDGTGTVTLAASQLGIAFFQATATDAAGNQGQATSTVTIINPAVENGPDPNNPDLPPRPDFDPTDNQEPIVTITSPEIAARITNLTPIIGTVDDPEDNLWYYQVLYARVDKVSLTNINLDDSDWITLHTGSEEVINGQLALFDPALVSNDAYAIVVVAFDGNGQGFVRPTIITVEGNIQVGNFRLEFTDLNIPLAGIPINITRVYDTVNASDEGDFGFGWSLGQQDARILEIAAIGTGGAFIPGNDQFVPDKTQVYLTSPSGERIGFTYKERLQSASFFGAIFTPYFEADPGIYETLTIDETQVARGGIIGVLSQGINPNNYTLTTKDGLRYRYNQFSGLQTITDEIGNVVTFTEDGIFHSDGESIQFVRDHRDRIIEVVDPSGNSITYEYNLAGDLISVTDQAGLKTRYEYLDDPAHYLDQAFDSLGTRVLKAVYEENLESRQFEFKGVIDAFGQLIDNREFDTANNSGVIRDGNGNATTLVYDDRGNVLEEIDPLGNITVREYNDPRNPDLETRIIDRDGNITDRDYDARGNLTRIIEIGSQDNPLAEPVITEFTYDSRNNVTSITNGLGHTTTFAYDTNRNLTRITNAENNSSFFTYDGQGRRQTFTDFNGHLTTFIYDAGCPCGAPHRVIFADGTYQVFEYNQFGQVTLEQFHGADGTLVEHRETKYDKLGRVIEEITGISGDPDHPQTIVRSIYDGHQLDWQILIHPDSLDANGNLLESPNTPVEQRNSRITDFEYDARDQLIRQIDAEGGIVNFRYDANGNRIALRDPVGNITTWVYDELNRMVEERDPLYWEELRALDAVFAALPDDEYLNLIAPIDPVTVADPLYDDPSGVDLDANIGAEHVRAFAYDGEGNQIEVIDRNGRRREFEYDYAGRLLVETWFAAVTAELVSTITFTYDTLGNMLTATDSNSNYLFTYDSLNRLTSVDNNPNEERDVPRVILTYGYDAQGNGIHTQDDSGVTVTSTYDARNRLATRTWFDADIPSGETADVDEARVDFAYNAIGRESLVTRYSDLAGTQLVGTTVRTYDSAGRSDLLTHNGPTGDLISGYDYDYDFAGLLLHEERTHEDPNFEQSIDYVYDLTGQLTDALFSGQDDEHYEYDANGNRIFSRVGTEERSYTTGPANQLESDGIYRYEYDGEGNQVKRVHLATAETRTFEYDHLNRLVRVDDLSSDPGDPQNPVTSAILIQSVEYTYDVFGRQIARIIDVDGGDTQVAELESFVYNGENVWADVNEAGEAIVRYLFGNRVDYTLARSQRSMGSEWKLLDRLGTTRDLLSSSGNAVAHVQIDSYGQHLFVSDTGSIDRFVFTGREYDNTTGYYYYRARFYDPNVGRFLSPDPAGFTPDRSGETSFYRAGTFNSNVINDFQLASLHSISAQLILPNLFVYVNNSPLSGSDPSGLTAISEQNLIHVESLTVTKTVASNVASRPFIRSTLQIKSILEAGIPVADASVPTALKWVVNGTFNGSRGVYELVIDTATNRILHFLFVSL